eukprot:4378375-Heterocapsa_arctica.AAC.1
MHRRQPQQLDELDVSQVKNGYKIFIWASLLCTAWTTWQYVNEKQNEKIDERMVNEMFGQSGVVRSHMKSVEKAKKV